MNVPSRARLTFRVELERGRLGPGKVELLERVEQSGSLAAAAREMKMSYRRAWELLTALNEMFSEPVAITHPGRNTTGATEVTPFGLWLIASYRRLERRLQLAAARSLRELVSPALRKRRGAVAKRAAAKNKPAK